MNWWMLAGGEELRAIVANRSSNNVTPLAWNGTVWVPGTVVAVGTGPVSVAISPDGTLAIVANYGSNNVTPLAWNGTVWVPGTVVAVGTNPYSVAIIE